jgi:hypothetical protein
VSNYTPLTNFTAKDNLTTGDPQKVIRGSEFDAEFSSISTGINSKANANNTVLTGAGTAVDLTVSGTLDVTGTFEINGTPLNISNWDTAYGWGDHSTAGYALAGDLGAVDTTVRTANFTAVAGKQYICNTSGGAFTLTLPSTPSAGDIVGFADYTGTFATANLTVARNGSNILGLAQDLTVDINWAAIELVYIDGTEGWIFK